ncbi:MAG: hypothetical protein V3U93_07235 [Alphaproteobacteria bacterium]
MNEQEKLRRIFDANIACGDIGEAEAARMRAEIAAAAEAEAEAKAEPPAATA